MQANSVQLEIPFWIIDASFLIFIKFNIAKCYQNFEVCHERNIFSIPKPLSAKADTGNLCLALPSPCLLLSVSTRKWGIRFDTAQLSDVIVRQTDLIVISSGTAITEIPIACRSSWRAQVHPAVSSLEACPTLPGECYCILIDLWLRTGIYLNNKRHSRCFYIAAVRHLS